MINKKLLNSYYKTKNAKLSLCLYPTSCSNKAILAHTIQNSRVFDLLAVKGHVIGILDRVNGDHKPYLHFGKLGRKEASTFAGLCSNHDNKLFEPIDNSAIDLTKKEQLFLLAYRAVLKELHAQMERAAKSQSLYSEKIEMGLTPKNSITRDGIYATETMMLSFETYEYKEILDEALLSENFESLNHLAIKVSHKNPSVACSQMFSADSVHFNNDVIRLILNVLPVSYNESIVIFSFVADEKEPATDYLHKCFRGDDFSKKYEISKMIIRNCENFFVNPVFYNTWSEKKKEEILLYFRESMNGDFERESPEVYLFHD